MMGRTGVVICPNSSGTATCTLWKSLAVHLYTGGIHILVAVVDSPGILSPQEALTHPVRRAAPSATVLAAGARTCRQIYAAPTAWL